MPITATSLPTSFLEALLFLQNKVGTQETFCLMHL